MSAEQRLLVLTGSYCEENENGINMYVFDEDSGTLTWSDGVSGYKNPTFLNVDPERSILYAITEIQTEAGEKAGESVAFSIDANAGKLTFMNQSYNVPSSTCHIQRDSEGKLLTVASYHGGMVGLISIAEDGSIGELLDVQQHEGKGVDPDRQDRPHPHSSFFSPDENYLFVQDLGLDAIISYKVDKQAGKLIRHQETKLHPGAGPRHFVFHPTGHFGYVINELDSSITAFIYNKLDGTLQPIQTITTLPDNYSGFNGCAEIAVSADGSFVYGSNRGHDSIVVYAVDKETGKLSLVQHVSTEGGHPRHFALTPSGQYLLAANRDGNNIVVFKVNQEDGTLRSTGHQAELSKPVCVQPFYFTVS